MDNHGSRENERHRPDQYRSVHHQIAEIIASNKFWDNTNLALKVFTPLVKVLRRVDGDKVPSMGFLYGDLEAAKIEIKASLDDEKKCLPIWMIIDKRWNEKLKGPLHRAGYFLNPYFFYEKKEEIEKDDSFMSGFVEVMHRFYPDNDEIIEKIGQQLSMYQLKQGTFGKKFALQGAKKIINPAQWWSFYGTDAPELRTMAMRILSLTTSSSGCERNWSTFEMWMMPQHQMKDHHAAQTIKLMAIMTERDGALNERDLALSEKRAAQAERDKAIFQRDAAIAERNNAIIERDNAIAALEYSRENRINSNGARGCSPGCNTPLGPRNMHHHAPSSLDTPDSPNNNHGREMLPTSAHSEGVGKAGQGKAGQGRRLRKEPKSEGVPSQKASKSERKSRSGNIGGELNSKVTIAEMHGEWRGQDMNGGDGSLKTPVPMPKKHRKEWKVEDLGGLNEVMFDEASMPVPVCSCTGRYQPCYKWGNGGWQSSCCTTTLSMYPLPVMHNKRHSRVSGRKMSGTVFTKLLSRLASEGHDLRVAVDLKDHWSKHGTNRYITIK